MSKFKECRSLINHWRNNEKIISLETNLYIFAEAQSSGSEWHYDYSTWEWNQRIIKIKEVGIHPELDHEQE
jgi:hypothetical protein